MAGTSTQVVVTSLGAENRSTSRVPAHGTGCDSGSLREQHAITAEVGERGSVHLEGVLPPRQPAGRSRHLVVLTRDGGVLHAALVGEAVAAAAREVDEVTRAASGSKMAMD